ncbi:unnamed protein product, partial [Brassica oleracea var. botrytis]
RRLTTHINHQRFVPKNNSCLYGLITFSVAMTTDLVIAYIKLYQTSEDT